MMEEIIPYILVLDTLMKNVSTALFRPERADIGQEDVFALAQQSTGHVHSRPSLAVTCTRKQSTHRDE